MHKAPTLRRPREIFDNHGRMLGQADGFRPDPSTGGLGLELDLTPEIVAELGAEVASVWVPDAKVLAVRRDRMMLDLSTSELAQLVHRPKPPAAEPAGDRLEA